MKLTKLEKYWILGDVGNSAFVLLNSTIIPIYFKNLAAMDGISDSTSTAYWGYTASISTIIIMILGPILGAVGDHQHFKKRLFTLFVMVGVLGCAALGMPLPWVAFLAVAVVAKTGFSGSLVFYDAMLPDVTSDERMHQVSSNGYAWGYLGSCIPFIVSLLLVLGANVIGISTGVAMAMAFILTAGWWLVASIPLIKNYKQIHYVQAKGSLVASSFKNLAATFKNIFKNKKILTFLIAFFLYIDGVYTIIDMATSYGKDVGISDDSLLLALLLTQLVAFPFAIIFGKLTSKIKTTRLISFAIFGYLGIGVFALWLAKPWQFWLLAVLVAVFQGAIQALSRSYFAGLIPKEKSNEYFGIFDIFGKSAAFLGTFLMGVATQYTQNTRVGVGVICLLILLGCIVFQLHLKLSQKQEKAL